MYGYLNDKPRSGAILLAVLPQHTALYQYLSGAQVTHTAINQQKSLHCEGIPKSKFSFKKTTRNLTSA
ncbi:MAG: hypothetical protein LUG18_04265 [Candidatus Azobacteroides sp.]|nr:hypothetical protein [Candidatus Azobacteroides sp.]